MNLLVSVSDCICMRNNEMLYDYVTLNKAKRVDSLSYIPTHNSRDRQRNIRCYSTMQKGKTNLDFTEARDSEWQWNQLGHMQVCISHQTDNHASTPPLSFYRPDALSAAQPTASKHSRQKIKDKIHR